MVTFDKGYNILFDCPRHS